MKEKTKKIKSKMSKIELGFTIFSIVFLVGFTILYAYRTLHYYKIFNPKKSSGEVTELMGITLRKNTAVVYEGSGLYSVNGNFAFKGQVDNNYVRYSNMLWRVIRINQDNSIVLVTDDYVNNLMWDYDSTDYNTSNIRDWLVTSGDNTGVFEKTLYDKENYLITNTVCLDKITELKEFTCNEKSNTDYVSLLNLSDYLNSIIESKTYINNTENIWLSTSSDEDKVWHASNGSVSKSSGTNGYAIKPVITLKGTNVIQSGSGTMEDPYLIETTNDKKLKTYSYVKLNDDIWTIYEENKDNIRLIYDGYLGGNFNTYSFSPTGNKYNVTVNHSLAKYLNTTFYDSLLYKDKLIDCDWYTGEYTDKTKYDYKNIYSEKVTAKVGIYNVADIKIDSTISNYFFLTPADDGKIYSFNNDENLYSSKTTYIKKIRPAICIEKLKITKGDGTKDSPYELEV